MKLTIKHISDLLGGEVEGNGDIYIDKIGKIEASEEGAISFLSNPKYESHIYNTKASAVIVSRKFEPKKQVETNLIKVDDPYSSFTALLEEYNRIISFSKHGIEEPSFVSEDATIGENIYRGAFSYIGNNTVIGKNVKIYPNAYIGNNVKIGDNTIIKSGARIEDNCVVGSYCTIHPNAVIGSDGFGFAPQEDGSYKAIPQIGNVILEDHVNVGANTTIDCATMGSTIIRSGVKLDNLIQIAHNVEIGENTVIAAQTGISGSTKIGKNCVIAGQVGIGGHLTIGDNMTYGAQAGVGKSHKGNEALIGSPAMDIKGYFKSYAIFKNLPHLKKRIEELEEKIVNLPTL